VTFLFVYGISPEPQNGFEPNSQGIRVWSLARTSLNVRAKGQGHQGVDINGIFGPFGRPACYLFLVKTSLSSSLNDCFKHILGRQVSSAN